MKKSLYFAFLLLTLLAVCDAKAQNYSSEMGGTCNGTGIWCRAMNSNADIYTEVYDESAYEFNDYSEYGDFSQEVVHSDGTREHINYGSNEGSASYGIKTSKYRIDYYDSNGTFLYSEELAADKDGGWLDEVEKEGRGKMYCPWCGEYIYTDEWNDHKCPSLIPPYFPETGSGNGGGGSNGNSNNVYDDIEDKSPYSSDLQTILESVKIMSKKIKELIEKFQEEGRFKEYEVEVDANGNKKKTNCYYDPADGCIHVPIGEGYNVDAITHELIHYLQEQNIQEIMIDGKLEERSQLDYDRCSADCEYQVYVMNFILNRIFNNSEINLSQPQGTKFTDAWKRFKDFFPNEVTFNQRKSEFQYTQRFIDELNNLDHQSLSEPFRSHYEAIDNYYESKGQKRKQENYYRHHDENYKYDWEKLFIELGFTKK
ncbi:MAG: hypothetical protein K6A78_10215 [Prevotella sp.]|nr:hypothetical protein [Prevotella sp.]